jgi:adenosylmethionine-8-amino-7-oxononanoate aminotransferase
MSRTRLLHGFAKPASTDFVTIVRGKGALVFDDRGRRYVDAMASLWYCNVGHGRAEIADAVATQLRTLAAYHTFDRFTNEPAEELAAVIADLAPVAESRVFFTCSGSEAVDSAIKLARISHVLRGEPERVVVVSRRNAYHGVTYGGLSAQGLPYNREGFGPFVDGFVNVAHDDFDELDALLARRGSEIALVLAEPVMAAGGVIPPVPGYLEGLRRRCDEHGVLLGFDEVVCGFGRLGTWWGASAYGVTPDLVTFAKGVTSGYQPLGGVVVGPKILGPLEADPEFLLRHGHTYSGHPGACVAGLKAIEITRRENLLARAKHVGARLADGLRELAADGVVDHARGAGALWAVELHEGQDPLQVRLDMEERGVVVRPLPPKTIAFCPPLVITDADVDRCIEVLRTVVARAEQPAAGP